MIEQLVDASQFSHHSQGLSIPACLISLRTCVNLVIHHFTSLKAVKLTISMDSIYKLISCHINKLFMELVQVSRHSPLHTNRHYPSMSENCQIRSFSKKWSLSSFNSLAILPGGKNHATEMINYLPILYYNCANSKDDSYQ